MRGLLTISVWRAVLINPNHKENSSGTQYLSRGEIFILIDRFHPTKETQIL
jgi:hypothetical protein